MFKCMCGLLSINKNVRIKCFGCILYDTISPPKKHSSINSTSNCICGGYIRLCCYSCDWFKVKRKSHVIHIYDQRRGTMRSHARPNKTEGTVFWLGEDNQ